MKDDQPVAKHICHRCHTLHDGLSMMRVSLQRGEYGTWTADRAASFRHRRLPFPALVWLCFPCSTAEHLPVHQVTKGEKGKQRE